MRNKSISCGTLKRTNFCECLPKFVWINHNITSWASCLEHVVNLANIAVMSHITKIATVETTTAIWEYDPSLSGNHVLGGSLDVIAVIWTLTIKVRYHAILFISLLTLICIRFRLLANVLNTLNNFSWNARSIIRSRSLFIAMSNGVLHSGCLINQISYARWVKWFGFDGSTHWYDISQPINLFLKSADTLYGHITTVHHNRQVMKKMPWSAFKLMDGDWETVRDVRDILKVCYLVAMKTWLRTDCVDRIRTLSCITSHLSACWCSGVLFQPSRNYKLHGRQNVTMSISQCTQPRSGMEFQNCRSIICGLTKSPVMCLR